MELLSCESEGASRRLHIADGALDQYGGLAVELKQFMTDYNVSKPEKKNKG